MLLPEPSGAESSSDWLDAAAAARPLVSSLPLSCVANSAVLQICRREKQNEPTQTKKRETYQVITVAEMQPH
jgi:hypothetical protein